MRISDWSSDVCSSDLTFSDPLLHLLENNSDAQRDLLEFRHTLEGSCAYYAALRATEVDRKRLTEAFAALQDCYAREGKVSGAEEGAADDQFHLDIAEANHNPGRLNRSDERRGGKGSVS